MADRSVRELIAAERAGRRLGIELCAGGSYANFSRGLNQRFEFEREGERIVISAKTEAAAWRFAVAAARRIALSKAVRRG